MNDNLSRRKDLEERTARFGELVITLCKQLNQDAVSRPLISQLVRSATGIGANYQEANSASSRKDFKNKIFICKKESDETKHWLRMVARCFPDKREDLIKLWQECKELSMIFQKTVSSLRKNTLVNE